MDFQQRTQRLSHNGETLSKQCHERTRGEARAITCCRATDTTNPHRLFSNHSQEKPFEYVVPVGVKKGTVIQCEHATKALECTKASIFHDEATFKKIMDEGDACICQHLGRGCEDKVLDRKERFVYWHWMALEWEQQLKEVAYEVLRQKFTSYEDLQRLLFKTGDHGNIRAYMGCAYNGFGLSHGGMVGGGPGLSGAEFAAMRVRPCML